jgi:crossover junction endodeoxyribonuclease RusA
MTLWRAPDGSERAKYAPEVVAHRNLVVGALADSWAGRAALEGPASVIVALTFPRPRSHYRTGRFSAELRPDAPELHAQYPDLDKACRLIFDALTVAGVWLDDKQACELRAWKSWGPTGLTQVAIYRRGET